MLVYNLDIEPGSLWLRSTPADFTLKQPFYCTEAGIFYAHSDFHTDRDYKDSYLLFHTIDGCGIIEQNGTAVHLHKGEALFMNCRRPQRYYTDPSAGIWTHYWIHIDGSGVAALEELLLPDQRIHASTVSGESVSGFDSILKNLENTSSDAILSTGLTIHAILSDFILRNTISYSANQKLILSAADYIKAHYSETIPLADLLEQTHLSKSYFMKLFRQYIGTTPYNYMLTIHITKAKELLELTDNSIHEIAMKTGFSDDASFSTRFSSMTGISPLKYRRESITRRQPSARKNA